MSLAAMAPAISGGQGGVDIGGGPSTADGRSSLNQGGATFYFAPPHGKARAFDPLVLGAIVGAVALASYFMLKK